MADTQVSEAAIRAPNMTLFDEAKLFIEKCASLAASKAPVTEEGAKDLRALQAEEVKLRNALDKKREAEKKPHLDAGRAVDAQYNGEIANVKSAIKPITLALTKFLEAEEAKARAAAEAARKAAAEEAARAAEFAAQAAAEEDPFDAFDAEEASRKSEAEAASLARVAATPVKVNVAGSDGSRAASLRTVGYLVTVTDASALVAHFAERQEFLDFAIELARREATFRKGAVTIPGCTITADRRAV